MLQLCRARPHKSLGEKKVSDMEKKQPIELPSFCNGLRAKDEFMVAAASSAGISKKGNDGGSANLMNLYFPLPLAL